MFKIKGFTIIELMIVLSILGILASVVIGAIDCSTEDESAGGTYPDGAITNQEKSFNPRSRGY